MMNDTNKLGLTKDELSHISKLLFTGKWNMSIQESQSAVVPFINRIAEVLSNMEKAETKEVVE